MGLINRIIIILFFTGLNSCNILKDAKLGLEKVSCNGMSFKLEGYYIGNLHGIDEGLRSIYFFYKNGVVLYGGGFSSSDDIVQKEIKFKSKLYNEAIKKYKTGWGVYQINGDTIEFETWEPSSGGALKTVVRSGGILGNESFVITNLFGKYTNENYARNDTFHFNEFSPKPDSTNVFIK